MKKDTAENESYAVSISDWISILQDKISAHANLNIFFASGIIGMIIIVPQLVREFMDSNMDSNLYTVSTSIIIVVLLGFLYWISGVVNKRLKEANEPYEELYKKIIYGEINDPKKIRDRYKEIEAENNKEKKSAIKLHGGCSF